MCFKCDNKLIQMAYEKETVGGVVMGCKSCGMCNPFLYNGGSWGSYADLCRYVREVILDMEKNGLRFQPQGGNLFVLVEKNNPTKVFLSPTLLLPTVTPSKGQIGINLNNPLLGQDGASLLGQDGASLIGKNGAGVVANDGAGLIATNAGKLFSDQGAGLIGKGGAGARGLLSVGAKKTVRIGRGTLVLS